MYDLSEVGFAAGSGSGQRHDIHASDDSMIGRAGRTHPLLMFCVNPKRISR